MPEFVADETSICGPFISRQATRMDDSPFQPYRLLRSERALIGQIFLLSAEIEGLITSALIGTANLDTTVGLTLLRSAGLEKKRQDLLLILLDEQKEELLEFRELDKLLQQFIDYRNVFAHGILIGSDGERLGFFTTKSMSVLNEEDAVFIVKRIAHTKIKDVVSAGETICQELRRIFLVKQIHEGVPWKQGEKPPGRKSRRPAS